MVFSFMKVLRPSATHCMKPFMPTMVPLLSMNLPSTLRSSHNDIKTPTNITRNITSARMIIEKALTTASDMSHSDTGFPGRRRSMSQATIPPRN